MPAVMRPISPCNVTSIFGTIGSQKVFSAPGCSTSCKVQLCKNPVRQLVSYTPLDKCVVISRIYSFSRAARIVFCYAKDVSEDLMSSRPTREPQDENDRSSDNLGLLNKPAPVTVKVGSDLKVDSQTQDKEEALEPFLKFFKAKDSDGKQREENGIGLEEENEEGEVEYYEPKPGDFVVGVVVSGNENKLDVDVGADLMGTMLKKEVLPLYDKDMDYLLCDLDKNAQDFVVNGKIGIVRHEGLTEEKPPSSSPVVDAGTVLFAEVLGRTLSGRPLLSARRLFRRVAWHRVRQIKKLDEPIEVRVTEWNTNGLLTRIEGLRAYIPKSEMVERVNSFTDLKEKVGSRMFVQICRVNEKNNDLVLSEREAREKVYLQEGLLVEGTVKKVLTFGAIVRIGQTNRSGLLHVSKISRGKVTSVSDLLAEGEKVKVLVLRPLLPEKISLSIADLEIEPGLFLSDKEKVFAEAEEMARKYRENLPPIPAVHKSEPAPPSGLPFDDEANLYANWKWFEFHREVAADS